MRLQGILWMLCLLSSVAVGWKFPGRDIIDLVVRANTDSVSVKATTSTTSPTMCELGGLKERLAVPTGASGTIIPTTLGNANEVTSSSPGSKSKRAHLPHLPRATLLPRTPGSMPLDTPKRKSAMASFMKNLSDKIPNGNEVNIEPSDGQIKGWNIPLTINKQLVSTPIGITATWVKFGDALANYKMPNLSGCTAVFIVGNTGFWAAHWWESTTRDKINGGSSFQYRFSDKADGVLVRTLDDFKKIAINPLDEPAPEVADTFISLSDLKNKEGDPFSKENGGGDILIFTRAKGPKDTERELMMYPGQISALKAALESSIHATSVTTRIYDPELKGEPKVNAAGIPEALAGLSILQYSPNALVDDNGCALAQARIYEEVNDVPPINRTWPATSAANKRDGAACRLPSKTSSRTESVTETSPASSRTASVTKTSPASSRTASIIETEPPCLPFSDPDSGIENLCQCSNGATIPPVTTLSTVGTTVYTDKICPWTTIPPQALTTAKPTKANNNGQYQFTYTDISKKVIACQTFTYLGVVAGSTELKGCAGSTALIYEPPLATMEMGSSKVNVGTTMTGEVLFTSISNALTSLCPTPTSSGAWTSCSTGTIKVGQAAYLENGKPEEGDLTIEVTDAQYNSSDYLNLFINMISGAANATATGSNCKLLDWKYVMDAKRDIGGRMIGPPEPIAHAGSDTFCNINSFLDTQWYDGLQEQAKMWFETEFGFELGELGNFDCSSTVDVVTAVLSAIFDAIFPEFAWLVETGAELADLACEAAEHFNPAKSKREIEIEKADAKLAKAWAKENKKDRKLPMPERKKRELGLID